MLQQVLTPDVDYECLLGTNPSQITEVLIRADANVDSAPDSQLSHPGHNSQVRAFVGNKVVAVEKTARLTERLHQFGPASFSSCSSVARRSRQREEQDCSEDEYVSASG